MSSDSESIWWSRPDADEMSSLASDSMIEHLGIRATNITDDSLAFSMPVDRRTVQPFGLLHGGASVALAETAASFAGHYCIDPGRFRCVGIEINANHVRSVTAGEVVATAAPIHLGKSTQVWSVRIEDESGRLVSICRVTMAVVPVAVASESSAAGHDR